MTDLIETLASWLGDSPTVKYHSDDNGPSVLGESPIVKCHPDHNDPSADVILVSKDGVNFRVHSWHIARASRFIDDLYTLPPSKLGDETSKPALPPIRTYSTSVVVKAYLARVYTSCSLVPLHMDTPRLLIELYHLCDRMQTTGWDDAIFSAIQVEAHKASWHAFTFAASIQDLRIARSAIRHFHQDPDCPPSRWAEYEREDWEEIPHAWMVELIRHRTTLSVRHEGVILTEYTPWSVVADLFSPRTVAAADFTVEEPSDTSRITRVRELERASVL